MEIACDNEGKSEGFEFYPQNKGEISGSITQSWTEQAIECYSVGGNCKMCSLSKGNYSFVCQMPKVIEILVKTVGEPFGQTA